MTSLNPACPIMTEECSVPDECMLQIQHAYVEDGDTPSTVQEYECLACGKKWRVGWPQVQPVFNSLGAITEPSEPEITPIT